MLELTKPGYYASHPKKFNERILLQQAKGTDAAKATQARDRLLVENEAFLMCTIRSWITPSSHYLFSELLQEARLAFLRAVDKYDLSRDISIRTLARFHLMKVKEAFFKKQPYVELKEEHLDEVCFQSEVDVDYTDLRETLNEAVTHLSPAEQEVIQLHFFQRLKSRAVALLRGCSEARISALIKSALQKLKVYLIGRGIQPGMFNFN